MFNFLGNDISTSDFDYIVAEKFNLLSEEWRLVNEIHSFNDKTIVIVGFSRSRKPTKHWQIGHNKPKRPVFHCIFDEKFKQSGLSVMQYFKENVIKAENYKTAIENFLR